jgi:hypothetical protein
LGWKENISRGLPLEKKEEEDEIKEENADGKRTKRKVREN